jgi:acyl-CoA thioester hydrolase
VPVTTTAPFRLDVPIRFSDTDMMGHVNHARFLSYLEEARLSMLAAGAPTLMGDGVILAHLAIDYRRPIMLDAAPVTVLSWVTDIGSSSFGIDYEMQHGEELVAGASSRLVAYDYAAGRPRPLSSDERDQLTALIGAAPVRSGASDRSGRSSR